ncbi:hypothetical protein D3C81_2259810 [compost metagenome]
MRLQGRVNIAAPDFQHMLGVPSIEQLLSFSGEVQCLARFVRYLVELLNYVLDSFPSGHVRPAVDQLPLPIIVRPYGEL